MTTSLWDIFLLSHSTCGSSGYKGEKKEEEEEEGLHRIVCKLQSASAADTKMQEAETYSQAEAFPVTLVGE